ncbi:glycoside hydrolase family 47 protein [Tricholoma matsutake]|nr:glycoside hydrolase family 47 protein [Tricholoma matsutake 945]
MPEVELRKRKKGQLSTPAGSTPSSKQQPAGYSAVLQTYSRLLYIAFVLAGLCFVYFNPTPVINLLDSWIGFSEQWDPSKLGVGTPISTYTPADTPKRDAVGAAFKHAWSAYERDAMGDDEYHPISRTGSNLTKAGGIGYTVIDSIDTMLLMGLRDEHARALQWVANKMSLDRDDNFNTFETTIRVLGGLLSAYHLSSGNTIYLEKAVELADRLLPAFDTPSGLPQSTINLATGKSIPNAEFPGLVGTAEVSTLQLEFRYLSYLTDNDIYWRKAENVIRVIKAARLPHGLASVFMNVEEGQYALSAIRLGSRGDSFYEYLLKQYLQTNGSEAVYRDMYDNAMGAIHEHLIQKTVNTKMTYTAELIPEQNPNGQISWRLIPKQDHLVCFLGGSLMLGATRTGALVHPVSVPPQEGELSATGKRDWKTGVELVKTCMDTHDTATGLSPEIVHFRIPSDGMSRKAMVPSDWYIKGARQGEFPPYDARYMLRPETVESLFIAFRLTHDVRYRDYGWRIFQSIEKHCRVETGGYAAVVNVDEVPARLEDKMETFMMSETLKYLYLLFDDSRTLPLDQFVFNTEAHPLPIFNPTIRTGFS